MKICCCSLAGTKACVNCSNNFVDDNIIFNWDRTYGFDDDNYKYNLDMIWKDFYGE